MANGLPEVPENESITETLTAPSSDPVAPETVIPESGDEEIATCGNNLVNGLSI